MTTKPPVPRGTTDPHPLDGKLSEIQVRAIMRALIKTEGNRTKAARRLGVSIRSIRLWIDRYPALQKAFPKKLNQYDEFIPLGVVDRGGQLAFIKKRR